MMKNNSRTAWAIAKTNFRQLIPAYIVTAAFVVIGIYNLIGSLSGLNDKYYVDMANYLYVLAVLAPIIISARNFNRIMHLGGNKKAFYWGAILNYGIIAARYLARRNHLLCAYTSGIRLSLDCLQPS